MHYDFTFGMLGKLGIARMLNRDKKRMRNLLRKATFCNSVHASAIRIFNYESSVFNYEAMLFNYKSLLFL